jgi:hypothetical protein
MMTPGHRKTRSRRGTALAAAVTLLLFVAALIACLSVFVASRAAMASGREKADRATLSARSGAEIILYVLQQIRASDKAAGQCTPESLCNSVQKGFSGLGMTDADVSLDGSQISVSRVAINAGTGQSFSAVMRIDSGNTVTSDIVGCADDTARSSRLKYSFATDTYLILDPAAGSPRQ